MEISNFLSLICNDSNYSLSKIWIDRNFSSCFHKYIFEFISHVITFILVAYNIGQRLTCSYRLWTFPLVLIRLASSLVLIITLLFYFYTYFFLDVTKIQWIDVINTLVISITYLLICYLNFNKNLYHRKRPWNYILWMIIFFLMKNYDIYRIIIQHSTLIEGIYLSIRQVCLGLLAVGLVLISCHKCHRSSQTHSK